jgi:hypothetical protein
MRISRRKLILINCAFLGSTAFGSVGFAARAGAQNVDAAALNQSASVTAQSTQSAGSTADEKLMKRVRDALHSDPYFYDEHVTVSVENGAVELRGFVANGIYETRSGSRPALLVTDAWSTIFRSNWAAAGRRVSAHARRLRPRHL